MAGQLLTLPQLNNSHSNSNSNLNLCTQGNQSQQQQQPSATAGNDVVVCDTVTNTKNSSLTLPVVAVKKQGVSGESCDATGQSSRDILIRKFEKDFR